MTGGQWHKMVHVDNINGRQVISTANSPAGALSVGHMRLSARLFDHISKAESIWREMEKAPHVSLHQSFDWCTAWAQMPGVKTMAALVSLDGRPAVLFPFEIVHKSGLRIARLIGTAHSNFNSPIYSAGFLAECDQLMVDELVDTLTALAIPADLIVIDKLRPSVGDIAQPLLCLPHVTSQNPSFQLPLLGDFAETLAQVNAKRRRKKFRVSERRLEEFGGYRQVEASDDASAQWLLENFLAQKSLRLKEQGLPDVFGAPGVANTLARLTNFSANAGNPVIKLFGIELIDGLKDGQRGKLISVAGLTEKQGHIICQFGSVDDRTVPEASAGELLFYLMIEQMNQAGGHVFDFGVGDQRYKRSWCPVMTEHCDVFIPLNMRGSLLGLVQSTIVRTKRFIKNSPRLRSVANRIRALTVNGKTAADAAD